jgi:Uma2 family endonuclease
MDVPTVIQYCTSEAALEEQMFSLRCSLFGWGSKPRTLDRRREEMFASMETGPLILRLTPAWKAISEHEFFMLCQSNAELVIERTAEGDLSLMPLSGGEASRRSFIVTGSLAQWAEADGTGVGFGALTGFRLPNGAVRAPDAAWLRRPRWAALTPQEREEFPPLCPDFVVELRSEPETMELLQEKMAEYIANGAQLGWLIDPEQRKVYVYRPSAPIVCHDDPQQVSGDPVLPGFVLEMRAVWGD